MKSIDREFFVNPTSDASYSLSGFWFWNDLITKENVIGQLDLMRRANINQPVIHARHGLLNEYLSEDWFSLIGLAIETARKNKQRLWIYDENNWPSGNCNWTITKDERYREHFLYFDESGAASVETDPYEPVGKLNVDYLSKEAISVFIKNTHDRYKERFSADFGGVVQGMFMDETRFCNAMPWTEALPEEFKKRKGYDLIPLLPLLRQESERSVYVRYDYYDVISDLYAEATYKQVYDWCEENKLLSTAHLLGEETIAAQSYFGADALRCVKYMHVPGIDHLGNGLGSLDAKFVASTAAHYGKSRVMCEAFGASGWDISYEELVRISNWLFQQGINLIIMHAFYYSVREERANDFPPSYFHHWRDWDRMPEYALMAGRMMNLLSDGYIEAQILVYSPMESYWRHVQHDLDIKTGFFNDGPWLKDENAALIDSRFQLVCSRLGEENLDYLILGADAAGQFSIKDGKLTNKNTGAAYEILVMPYVSVLTEDMAALVDAFRSAGGKVILYHSTLDTVVSKNGSHMRRRLQGPDVKQFDSAESIDELVALCRKQLKEDIKILEGTKTTKRSLPGYPPRLIDPYIHDGELVSGVGAGRYRKADGLIYNLTNYNDRPERLRLWVRSARPPELFDPETGEIEAIHDYSAYDGGYEFSVMLRANRSRFVVVPIV